MSIRMGDKILSGVISIDELATLIAEKLTDFDKNLLHKTGNETKNGELTTTGLFKKTNEVSFDETPSSNVFSGVNFVDRNGEHFASCEVLFDTYGDNIIQLNIRNKNGDWSPIPLQLQGSADGTFVMRGPSPKVSSESNDIATTSFVKSVLSSSGAGLATIFKSRNGYCKFTNGLLIQWGTTSVNSGATITFPTPFTMSIPSVQITYRGFDSINACDAQSISTSSFTFRRYSGGSNIGISWIAIGY